MTNLIACMLLAASFHTAPDTLVGHYTLDPEAGDDPAEVAEEATRDVGRFRRGRMRDRLEKVLTPSPTLEIRREEDAYVLINDDGRSLRVVPGGPEVEQETPDGETARIAATLEEGALVIRIRTERGERLQTLTPTDVGLQVINTYTVERLDEPIRMETVYRSSGTPR
jgi:hypothetical protein